MSSNEYAISLKTNRLIKKSTANYRKLKKLNQIKEIEPRAQPRAQPSPEPEPDSPEPEPEPEFNERDLQNKLAELSTTVVQRNMKKIIKSQKLSDTEYDLLLKKMLYEKLCLISEPPVKPTKKKKKKKFKIVQPSSSESDSD